MLTAKVSVRNTILSGELEDNRAAEWNSKILFLLIKKKVIIPERLEKTEFIKLSNNMPQKNDAGDNGQRAKGDH